MAEDPFAGAPPEFSSDRWYAITPDDDSDLPVKPRAVHCAGGDGAVVCVDASGEVATFYFQQGTEKPIRPSRVLATGTTATGLVALW